MPTTTQHISGAAPAPTTEDYELSNIGIELEYPVVQTATNCNCHPSEAPRNREIYGAELADLSSEYYDGYPRREWLSGEDFDGGYMGSDHTGAEITSGILNLHTDEPERWYEMSIHQAEDDGYPFAATGFGRTVFGLHNHVSSLPEHKKEAIEEMCSNEWARVFFCSSVNHLSIDPWRHGGVREPGRPFSHRSGREDGHEEFRLIEPLDVEHFGLVMDFWRMVETDGVDYAADVARQLVLTRDERLTAVRRYRVIQDQMRSWPDNVALRDDRQTDEHAAYWFRDYMEG